MGQETFSCGHTVCYMGDEKPKRCPQCKYDKAVSKAAEKDFKKKGKKIDKVTVIEEENTFKDAEIEVKKDARPERKW